MSLETVVVNLGDRSYPVVVGHGAIASLTDLIGPAVQRCAVVTQEGIPTDISLPIESQRFVIERGEKAKTLATIDSLSQGFAEMGLTRNDVIIAVGGGMVTDVAGFAASAWHRGTPVIHVATTLLGMVDAAIGGKTGVNLPQGKNLVGAFWQPVGVICDLDALSTLPESEMRCGLGEVAKYHFLTGDDLLSLSLEQRVAQCVRIKGSFVEKDEREGGQRALLNYGHTLAHALEIVGGHHLAHGEAVAIGLVFAAHLAHAMNRIPGERVDYHDLVVSKTYGLASRVPHGMSVESLLNAMSRDKKAVSGLTFVLDSEHGPQVVSNVSSDLVREVLTSFMSLA